MGVEDLIPERIPDKGAQFKTYGYHPKEDVLYDWADELQERFPEEVRIDFIEVSPEIESYRAKAYWRPRGGELYQFIRFAQFYVEDAPDWRIYRTLLHEMVHLYTYQKGYSEDVGDTTPIFTWLCGRVGTHINRYPDNMEMWQELAEPFLEKEDPGWDQEWSSQFTGKEAARGDPDQWDSET